MVICDFIISASVKEILGFIAVSLTFFALVPYLVSTTRKTIRPHAFSWIIWGFSNVVIFAAQMVSNAGVGAFSIGAAGILAFVIAGFAYYEKADDTITRFDWIVLTIALSALPLWYITSSALSAVLILTGVDVCMGYLPTIRKAYHKPDEEQIHMFIVMSFRNLLSIAALTEYSFTNVFFQIATLIANVIVVSLILRRRSIISSSKK